MCVYVECSSCLAHSVCYITNLFSWNPSLIAFKLNSYYSTFYKTFKFLRNLWIPRHVNPLFRTLNSWYLTLTHSFCSFWKVERKTYERGIRGKTFRHFRVGGEVQQRAFTQEARISLKCCYIKANDLSKCFLFSRSALQSSLLVFTAAAREVKGVTDGLIEGFVYLRR